MTSIGSVFDRECQAWSEITERDGKLYGFPDSSKDGTPATDVVFIGQFNPEPRRFYIGNVVKANGITIGLVVGATCDEAGIKAEDGYVYWFKNDCLEIVPENEVPSAVQTCETCKALVEVSFWHDGPAWCLDCISNQQE